MRGTRQSVAWVVALASAQVAAAPSSACGSDLALPLSREQTGHVSTQLVVNGKQVRFLVDTGANVNTLDTTQGAQLNPAVVASQGSAKGEGSTTLSVAAAGQPLGEQQFAVMNLHFINIPAKRYGTEPFVGQLGASFFEAFAARIDFAQMVLCLRPARAPATK